MTIEATTLPDAEVSCANCEACCCRLEVLLITDTGVPDHFIEIDKWGGQTMARLEDGWCSALDRDTMKCTIYDQRPWVCREFEVGEYGCIAERAANPGLHKRTRNSGTGSLSAIAEATVTFRLKDG